MKSPKVYPGARIGSLIVIEKDFFRSMTNDYWICHCDCGETCSKLHNRLTKGLNPECPKCTRKINKQNKVEKHLSRLNTVHKDFQIIEYVGKDTVYDNIAIYVVKCLHCSKKYTLNSNQMNYRVCPCRNRMKGESHPMVKFSDVDVQAVRDFYSTKLYKIKEIASMLGMSESNVGAIVNFKSRK